MAQQGNRSKHCNALLWSQMCDLRFLRCHLLYLLIIRIIKWSMGQWTTSATTLVSVWNTRVFRSAQMALTKPHTLWRRITRFPSPWRRVTLHTHRHYYAPGIRTIRTTCVLHFSQGLQLCCSCSHNAWPCLCLSLADSHILPLRYCYISDAALAPSMFSFEILSHIAIQSSLRIPRLPLHLLRHYRILHVWNIQANLHTL
jgi:hypothetical protein